MGFDRGFYTFYLERNIGTCFQEEVPVEYVGDLAVFCYHDPVNKKMAARVTNWRLAILERDELTAEGYKVVLMGVRLNGNFYRRVNEMAKRIGYTEVPQSIQLEDILFREAA